jgi:hypothetical protein
MKLHEILITINLQVEEYIYNFFSIFIFFHIYLKIHCEDCQDNGSVPRDKGKNLDNVKNNIELLHNHFIYW